MRALIKQIDPDRIRATILRLTQFGTRHTDFTDIDDAARAAGVGVVAAGNFSLTAAMAQAAALLVARHLPNREIIDYASAAKHPAGPPASWPSG